LGSIPDAVSDEVEDVWDKTEDWINTLENIREILGYMEKICQVKSIIVGILGAIDSLVFTLNLVFDPTGAMEVPKKTLCEGSGKLNKIYGHGIFSFLNGVCGAISCHIARPEQDLAGGAFTEYLTGGAPWCRKGKDLFEKLNDNPVSEYLNLSFPTNVKESILWSTACLCLPGIAFNVDKIVQIYCKYGLCMLEDVAEQGLPIKFCKEEKDYDICALVIHELFAATPFGALSSFVRPIVRNGRRPSRVLGISGLQYPKNSGNEFRCLGEHRKCHGRRRLLGSRPSHLLRRFRN